MAMEGDPSESDPERLQLRKAAEEVLNSTDATVPGSHNIVNARLAHIEKYAIAEKRGSPGNHVLQRRIAFDAIKKVYADSPDMLKRIEEYEKRIDSFIKEQ